MNPGNVVLLLLTAGLLYLLVSRTRRQRREALAIQSRLTPGIEVMTSSGLFATVVEVDGDVVVLETGPGQRSRWDRRAIARILPEGDDAEGDDAGGDDASEAGQEETAPERQGPPEAITSDPPAGRD